MYGGLAKVPSQVEGLARVVEWSRSKEHAAVTHFVWLRRMKLMLKDHRKEGKCMCPCQQLCEWRLL